MFPFKILNLFLHYSPYPTQRLTTMNAICNNRITGCLPVSKQCPGSRIPGVFCNAQDMPFLPVHAPHWLPGLGLPAGQCKFSALPQLGFLHLRMCLEAARSSLL